MDQWQYKFREKVTEREFIQVVNEEGSAGWEFVSRQPSATQVQGQRRDDLLLKKKKEKNWQLGSIPVKASATMQDIIAKIKKELGNNSGWEIVSVATVSAQEIKPGEFKAIEYRIFIRYHR